MIHAASALLPAGWTPDVRLAIDNGAIGAIETGVPPQEGDERHAIVIPAVANLHSHAFQRAMAGLAEIRGEGRDTFWTWRETMYRFALTMTPDDVEAVAAQLYVEMLEAGFAAVAEFHYLHQAPDGSPYAAPAEMAGRIIAAARAAGIGLTLLPVFYAHSTFGGAAPMPEQRRFITNAGSFARLLDDCRRQIKGRPDEAVGVAPHSLRAVTPRELSDVIALGADGPIHIHVAEQLKEVEDCVAWSGARPVRWLLDHAAVDDRWCLVHATHMDEAETRDAANSRAVAGLCPITEANLGDGVFNAQQFLRHRGRFGVGSELERLHRRGGGVAPARIRPEASREGAQYSGFAKRLQRAGDAGRCVFRRLAGIDASFGAARHRRHRGYRDPERRSPDACWQNGRPDSRRLDLQRRE